MARRWKGGGVTGAFVWRVGVQCGDVTRAGVWRASVWRKRVDVRCGWIGRLDRGPLYRYELFALGIPPVGDRTREVLSSAEPVGCVRVRVCACACRACARHEGVGHVVMMPIW